MKVKNLLLAGLAVAAMTACSNDIEGVDNSNQTKGEEASMRINLKFANEVNTRASGDTDPGDVIERNATSVTAIISYPNNSKRYVYKDLDLVTSSNNIYQTEAFTVEAGEGVSVEAIINYDNKDYTAVDATTNLTDLKVGAYSLPTSGLAYINSTVAAENAFLMSGSTEKGITIEAGSTTNVAPITVNRVAAKLDEKTDLAIPFAVTSTKYINKDNSEAKISVKLEGYSFSNLSSSSYVFNNSSTPAGFLQEYKTEAATDDTYRWITENITYCLENKTSANPTRVHYKGQVHINDVAINDDFYIRATTHDGSTEYHIFTSWNELITYYNDANISKLNNNDKEVLSKYGIMRYTAGICYYEADIKTIVPDNKAEILRNNWYQLTVSKISKIGTPTPAPEVDGDATMLTIETTVNPWTIQVNDFEL